MPSSCWEALTSGDSTIGGYRLVRGAAAQQPGRQAGVELDPAQQAVVDHSGGPLLVLAGPGTGKTATIVEAVIDRITNRGADPESVLMLTFSRKAAEELRGRVTARLGRTTREPLARTFHSYAFGLLRAQAVSFGEPTPRLLSGPEQDLVIRELLLGALEDGAPSWPAELRPALRTRGFAEELRDLLLRAVERGVDPTQLSAYGKKYDRPEWHAAALFLQEYLDVTALSGSTAYDPAELIRAAVEALRSDPALLSRERAARRRIFVDEYQDTDPAQEELLRVLGTGADELVVVGDPDQSIYAFRGADPLALRRFPDEFRRVDGDPAPTVALRTSRRSGATLLAATRRVATRLTGPAAHRQLRSAGDLPAGLAEVHLLRSASEEAGYIAHRLRAAHLRDSVPWHEMAVLVRSTPRTLPQLRRALTSAGVPITVGGDELPLVDQPAVSAMLQLLRVALKTVELTDDAAVELLTSPFGAADALALRKLRRELRAIEIAAGGHRNSGSLLVEAIQDPATVVTADDRAVRPVKRLHILMNAARTAAAHGTAEDVLWAVWSASGLAPVWERASRTGGALGAMADRDLDAMVAFFDAAARYVDRLPAAGPAGFLEHLAGQQIPGDTLAPRAPAGDTVRIMTAHAAKGLQWELVCVAGVQEGVWPDLRRRGSLLGSELLVDVVAGRDGTSQLAPLLDEERRLFYVAVTRARKDLVVTAVRGDEETPSRFLDELDPATERPITTAPRALSLPAMVAELRSVATDPTQRRARRRSAAGQLARLAAEGVPGAAPDEWWGLAALSDDRPLADPGQRVPVSPSAVEKFGRCQLRWLLESVGASGGPATPQAIGNLIHDLAAWSASPDKPDAGELAERLDELLAALDLGGPWAQRKERTRAHMMLGNFLGWLASHKRELVGAELAVNTPVGDRAVLRGRVDRLERDADGRFVVIDLKTGRSAPTKADLPRQPQLGAYQLAISEGGFADLVGESAEPGGAALVQLGRGVQAKVQVQPPLADDEEPEWARRLVQSVADGMGGGQFLATPGSGCRTCPGRPSCPAVDDGRQVPGSE